jgi:predicted RNase H-like nuclease
VEGKGLSIQAWAIVPKIREIDDALRGDAGLRSRVREVHPEVCFYFMAGCRPMRFAKKKRDGHAERCELLRAAFGQAVDEALAEMRGSGCASDDVVDAFAALWTAQRIMTGDAITLPASPGRDRFGLPMEMVA